jgi:hypothetical protein
MLPVAEEAVWVRKKPHERVLSFGPVGSKLKLARCDSEEGNFQMCDYSLFAIPNRLAREQEDLVAHRFPTGSMGLASPVDLRRCAEQRKDRSRGGVWATIKGFFTMPKLDPVPAVCIPPGASLRVQDMPARLQQELAVKEEEDVVFTQTSASVNTYRDAVRFSNGRELNLQELHEGQRVRVLSLALAEPMPERVIEEPQALLYRAR